jgi:hypothetical protein
LTPGPGECYIATKSRAHASEQGGKIRYRAMFREQ